MPRYLFVEDTYGVEFHRFLLEKIIERKLVKLENKNLIEHRIYRMPAKKCNPSLTRKVKARLLGIKGWKCLFIIDSERRKRTVAAKDVLDHFRGIHDNIRVVVISPRHEKWLCIGLGGKIGSCRGSPEDVIVRLLKERGLRIKYYEKSFLAKYTKYIDMDALLIDRDFKDYIEAVEWLFS